MNHKKAFLSAITVFALYMGFLVAMHPNGLALGHHIVEWMEPDEVSMAEEVEEEVAQEPILEPIGDSKPMNIRETEEKAREDLGNAVREAEEDLGQTVRRARADFQQAVYEASGR